VARVAGVSRATVSAYINKTRFVSPELSQKIQKVIDELNYTPDELARSLKMQDTKTIGLIIPVLSNFFMPMLQSINEVAQKQGYSFLLYSSEENLKRERKMLEIFMSKRISGILIVPSSEENRKFMMQIIEHGMPLVQVNRKIIGLETDYVISKNFSGIYKATEYILKKGRKKILFVGYNANVFGEDEKKYGYEAAIKDYRVNKYIINIIAHDPESILESLNEFFLSGEKIDGMVCDSQMRTSVALQYLKNNSLRIPDDISFIGYEDTYTFLYDPPLTVISERASEMGKIATNLLLDRIKKKDKKGIESVLLDLDFIIRESC